MKNNKYFVYIYLDPRKHNKYCYDDYCFSNEPFYVGKGGGNKKRENVHLFSSSLKNGENKYKVNKINKIISCGLKPIIIKFKDMLTEKESFDLEVDLISTIGRKDKKQGPLTNLTAGGEGVSGWVLTEEQKENRRGKNNGMYGVHRYGKDNPFYGKHHDPGKFTGKKNGMYGKHHSDEYKKKLSEKMSGENHHFYGVKGPENPNFGKKRSDETKNKLSKSLKGRVITNEHRRKISKTLTGKFTGNKNPNHKYEYTFISPNGKSFLTEDLESFCKNNELKSSAIRSYFSSRIYKYKGWTFSKKLKEGDKKCQISP